MATSLMDIKSELVVWLRNSDVISTGNRGVTTSQDTGTFTADLTYTLSTNPTLLKNVRDVTVGTLLEFGTDYTVNYVTGVITFNTAQTGNYTINYDQGSSDSIYPDFPQTHLKLDNFPRIAIDIITSTSNEIGIGAGITESQYGVTVVCYDKDQTDVEVMVSAVKSQIMTDKKNLFYPAFITPTNAGPLLVSEFGKNKIFQRNQDLDVRFNYD